MNLHPITLLIIILNVYFSYRGFKNSSFFDRYKFNIASIKSGNSVAILSSGFLHVDLQHLIFNMVTLYFFADIVISFLNPIYFVLIYLGSLLFGNLLTLFFQRNNNTYSAVGASGAVTGILYAAILLYPSMDLFLYFIPIPIPAYVVGLGYMLYSIYGMKRGNTSIGHDAHFGGAIGGYLFTIILAPWVIQKHFVFVLLLAVPIILLVFLKKNRYL
jgi:membrane associated rhomboid family serine protease